ncbi:hypothetical protein P0998_23445 [Xanthomonas hortorum pv. gardneri]|uniref:hypothetical protein n=1 Tax=Xanthomonas hortorum TaxID=56454 RepID=UPI0039835CDF
MNTQKQLTEPANTEKGEAMMLCFEKDSLGRYRPVIFIGPADAPESATDLIVGNWSTGLRKAQKRGIPLYFDTYAKRYGFKHPEDPTRRGNEGPLPATVASLRSDGQVQKTWTSNSDVEVAGVR